MKIKKYKIPTWFINQELSHKVDISYDNETKRSYDLLDILRAKFYKIDNRKKLNQIEVTEEEYQTWYVYFLEYYIDDQSIYVGSKEEKEAKKLLRKMNKFFGNYTFNENHRAGAKLRFVQNLIDSGLADRIVKTNNTIN